MSADALRVLSNGMQWRDIYVICSCGAWNTRSKWHIQIFHDRCYSCAKPLFKTNQELVHELGEHLWKKAWLEHQSTQSVNVELMALALELGEIRGLK